MPVVVAVVAVNVFTIHLQIMVLVGQEELAAVGMEVVVPEPGPLTEQQIPVVAVVDERVEVHKVEVPESLLLGI